MKRSFFKTSGLVALFLGAGFSQAETEPASPVVPDVEGPPTVKLEPVASLPKNRIGLAYQMGLNITVDFRNLGGLSLSDPGPSTGSRFNRNYDDGYNRVDSSANAGAATWNWGYTRSQSVQDNNLVLQSYSTPANITSDDRHDDPYHGLEAFYQRELRHEVHWRFGVEAAFGYHSISISDSQAYNNLAYRTSDAFTLNGTVPPFAPYQGTFGGPGDLIGSTPSRSVDVLPGAAAIFGSRHIDADLFALRLGPYLEFPLNDRWKLFVDGGLTLAWARTEFSFNETVTINDPAYDIHLTGSRSATGSQTDFLVGCYAGGGISYALTKEVNLFAGAQFQAAGRAINNQRGKQASFNLNKSILISVGVSYSF